MNFKLKNDLQAFMTFIDFFNACIYTHKQNFDHTFLMFCDFYIIIFYWKSHSKLNIETFLLLLKVTLYGKNTFLHYCKPIRINYTKK